MQVRLQKFLADAGIASRRAAEKLIVAGRVSVNALPVTALGSRVDPAADRVHVDGQLVRGKRKLYVALNKPAGCLCTRKDGFGRRTVLDLLPPDWSNLYPVGRLDADTEGLLFLTNDGDFCLRLTHPRFGVVRRFLATVQGHATRDRVQLLLEGVVDGGDALRARAVRVLSANQTRSVVELHLTEGRNREVRRMLAALGFTVSRLQRVQIGPIRLGELKPGRWRTLTEGEIKSLLATT